MLSFLEMRKNTGNEEERARDLFYALLDSRPVYAPSPENGEWTLMCPDECPGLQDTRADFDALYEKYEREGKGKKTLKASDMVCYYWIPNRDRHSLYALQGRSEPQI